MEEFSPDKLNDVAKFWERLIKEEFADCGDNRCASDEELFANAYHKMVHSPVLDSILKLEHMYSKAVREKTDEKNMSIEMLARQQVDEMNNALDRLETDMTETKINELVSTQYEIHNLLKCKLTSELDTIKEAQRREYREWLMEMIEQSQTTDSQVSIAGLNMTLPRLITAKQMMDNLSYGLEESFTIYLGSQLKQMYNIRIISADILELCAAREMEYRGSSDPKLHILQTALTLYSNELAALVLITDKSRCTLGQDFQDICQSSTEFHFNNVDVQMDNIQSKANAYFKSDLNLDCPNKSFSRAKFLQAGDFYLTRHSNLAQVHVVFHLITDDTIKANNDITSRHPIMASLRNILKSTCSNDITSLTIPLLLQYDLSEEMTVLWCEKRAELVLKCMKGYMIEMASWGGADLKNLQFLVPKGISSEVFVTLSDMLPKIFKVSNPKVLN